MDRETGVGTVGSGAVAARRIPAEDWRARDEGRRLVEEARREAGRILDEAGREADAIRRDAELAGREEGLARAAHAVLQAAGERDRLLGGCAGELAGLAADMATRILGREIAPGADAVAAAARALAEVRGEPRVTLRVSPADASAVREDGALRGIVGALRLREDASLATGEVIVEAGGATVDGRFAARLAFLRRVAGEGAA